MRRDVPACEDHQYPTVPRVAAAAAAMADYACRVSPDAIVFMIHDVARSLSNIYVGQNDWITLKICIVLVGCP